MKRAWWKEAIGYQIYPSTFFDSNGDGIGDIRGICEKLPYIISLGVTCLWICPFFKSPMDDNGYDISDFYQVNPIFGDIKDFQELLNLAHQQGLRIIIDLVLNQTSDEHPWFIEAKQDITSTYHDYYIWQDPKFDNLGNKIPPTNWSSFFSDSAWAYQPEIDQYYLKIFSKKMPDLNWNNSKCRQAMYDMALNWLELGVDGFRMDAIAHLAKDTNFGDSQLKSSNGNYVSDWQKFSNRENLFDYLAEFKREVLDRYPVMSVGEVGGKASPQMALKYSGYQRGSLNMVFTFDHCWLNGVFNLESVKDEDIVVDVVGLKNSFYDWYQAIHGKGWQALYWLNHDHPRVISQYGDPISFPRESGIALANTLYLMPGTPFVYNGEEIGMSNVDYNEIEDFNDVWVKNYAAQAITRLGKPQLLNYLRHTSRVNARTPMQWSNEIYGGFSTKTPIYKVNSNYCFINVSDQDRDPKSLLNHYRWLFYNRQNNWLDMVLDGSFEFIAIDHIDVFAYKRSHQKQSLVVISNFRSKCVEFTYKMASYEIISNNYDEFKYSKPIIYLMPWQSIIINLGGL